MSDVFCEYTRKMKGVFLPSSGFFVKFDMQQLVVSKTQSRFTNKAVMTPSSRNENNILKQNMNERQAWYVRKISP